MIETLTTLSIGAMATALLSALVSPVSAGPLMLAAVAAAAACIVLHIIAANLR